MKGKIWMKVFVLGSILLVFAGQYSQIEAEFLLNAPTDTHTLTILAHGEPDQLDPATCYDSRGSFVIHNLYDRLVGYDSPHTTVITGRLAERWEISPDRMEYIFYLRRDAEFHDGTPVTAHAVKYSLDRVLKMNQPPAWMITQCMDSDSTEVIDEYTVKITLTKPYQAFLSILCYTVASIVNPDVVEQHGGVVKNKENEWLNDNEGGAGSGPYKMVKWVHSGRIVLNRYDNYWRGPAQTENVEILFIPEISTRISYLKRGDADIATGFPESDIPDIEGAEGITVLKLTSYDTTFVVLGCRGSLSDKKVRQAVSMAVDYNKIIESFYLGYGALLNGPLPKGIFGWHNINPYTYDIEGANALLDGAGYSTRTATGYRFDPSTGGPLGAEIAIPSGDKIRSQIASLLQGSLKEIGFELKIREISWSQMYKLIRNEETDMIISGWLPDYGDPDNYIDNLCSSSNAKAIWGSDYENEELDDLIDQAKWEGDREARKNLYYKILLIIKEDAPFVWLVQRAHIEVIRTEVKGYFYNPLQPTELWRLYKEKGEEEPSETEPPATEAPATEPPETEPSVTEPPATESPEIEPESESEKAVSLLEDQSLRIIIFVIVIVLVALVVVVVFKSGALSKKGK